MIESIENIVLIGAGNVATVLGQGLHDQGLQIVQVYNRTLANAKGLAQQLSSDYTDQLAEINTEADLYMLCVSDHAIADLVEKLAFLQAYDPFWFIPLVLHLEVYFKTTLVASVFFIPCKAFPVPTP